MCRRWPPTRHSFGCIYIQKCTLFHLACIQSAAVAVGVLTQFLFWSTYSTPLPTPPPPSPDHINIVYHNIIISFGLLCSRFGVRTKSLSYPKTQSICGKSLITARHDIFKKSLNIGLHLMGNYPRQCHSCHTYRFPGEINNTGGVGVFISSPPNALLE